MTTAEQPIEYEAEPFLDTTTFDDIQREELDIADILNNASFLRKIRLGIFGSTFLQNYQKKEWKNSLPLFAFRCKKHGVQIGYPAGWRGVLLCLPCFQDEVIN